MDGATSVLFEAVEIYSETLELFHINVSSELGISSAKVGIHCEAIKRVSKDKIIFLNIVSPVLSVLKNK